MVIERRQGIGDEEGEDELGEDRLGRASGRDGNMGRTFK